MKRRCYKCNSKGRQVTDFTGWYGHPEEVWHLNSVPVADNEAKRGYSMKYVCDDCLEKGNDDA